MQIVLSFKPVSAQRYYRCKCQLQFGKEGKVLPHAGFGKPLHDKPTTGKVKGDNNCYIYGICSISCLSKDITGSC